MPKGVKLPKVLPVGSQCAALCFRTRKKQDPQVLLITSRGSGRWILPKGWPMDGFTPWDTAAEEAYEEAGILGQLYPCCIGRYDYVQPEPPQEDMAQRAYVFAIKVTGFDKKYPEVGERQVKWFSPKKAAELVREPKLAKIILHFDADDFGE